jgi:hypothetical protein
MLKVVQQQQQQKQPSAEMAALMWKCMMWSEKTP